MSGSIRGKYTITAALLATAVGPFFVYNAACQTSVPFTEIPSMRTAADIKDHTANIGALESNLYFNHCSFSGHDSAIVREAYRGFLKRLGGVKPVVPAPEALTLNAKDCQDLATNINGMVGWHAREGSRPASQE
jgi:hypothetical protein